MLLTIIIPFYNTDKTMIDRCLSSIRDIPPTVEIIIVNDGSEEVYVEQLEHLILNISNIKLISTTNFGVSHARNIGIEHATGDYITFLDSDDYVEFGWFKAIEPYLISKKYDLILWELVMNNVDKGKMICNNENDVSDSIYITSDKKIEVIPYMFITTPKKYCQYPSGPYCKAIKRELLLKYKIQFDESLKRNEDALFNLYLLENSNQIIKINKAYYYYVIHEQSTLHVFNENIGEELKNSIHAFSKYVNTSKIIKENNLQKYFYIFVLATFRSYMHTFIINKKNKQSFFEKIRYMKLYCNQEIFRESIKKVEWKQLNSKDKIILLFIRLHMYSFLLFLYILLS